MQVNDDQLLRGFSSSVTTELRDAWNKILHCMNQLTDEQIWARRDESKNSIANLIRHLNGNLQQWIVAGVGDAKDARNRPGEFADRSMISRQQLIEQTEQTLKTVEPTIAQASAEELLRQRTIQGFNVTGFDAVVQSVSHFRGHSQEIVHMTRELIGDAYQFQFVPSNSEQGAPE